nr:TetR/AcrR family transcriptional regulator [Angustibacter sp. Root456]
MASNSHMVDPAFELDSSSTGALMLDAARECILAVGWKRTTLTDVARRAGVSRMTIYRSWPDMQTLLADLMTREWSGVASAAAEVAAGEGTAAQRLVTGVVGTVRAVRANPLLRRIIDVDPELLLPYLLDRPGRSQEAILALLEHAIRDGQRDGSIRLADPGVLARTVLLAAHGATISAQTMADDDTELDRLVDELATLVERYVGP